MSSHRPLIKILSRTSLFLYEYFYFFYLLLNMSSLLFLLFLLLSIQLPVSQLTFARSLANHHNQISSTVFESYLILKSDR